jgi:hypothetical protein
LTRSLQLLPLSQATHITCQFDQEKTAGSGLDPLLNAAQECASQWAQKANPVTLPGQSCVLDFTQIKERGRPLKRLAWSILIMLPIGAPATEVYRSIDANGHVIYSDRPGDAAETVVVRPVVDTFDASARKAAEDQDSQQPELNAVLAAASEAAGELSAAERARNCEVARERAETYAASRRLFRTLPDGEREYLSSAEIDEARARAQSDVANWCD